MKNLEYDYHKLDRLSVSLNSVITEEILICYRALGWKQAERTEDVQFGNVEHFEFFRPHDIKGKDRLQLLQVTMETEVNNLAHATVNKHVYSLAAGICMGLLCLALVVWGVLLSALFYRSAGAPALVWGIVLGVLGVAAFVFSGFFVYKIVQRENERYEKSVRKGLDIIDEVYREACEITGADNE